MVRRLEVEEKDVGEGGRSHLPFRRWVRPRARGRVAAVEQVESPCSPADALREGTNRSEYTVSRLPPLEVGLIIPRVEDSVERSPRRKSPVWMASPGDRSFPETRTPEYLRLGETDSPPRRARREREQARVQRGCARDEPPSRFRGHVDAPSVTPRVRVLPSRGRSEPRPDPVTRDVSRVVNSRDAFRQGDRRLAGTRDARFCFEKSGRPARGDGRHRTFPGIRNWSVRKS